MTTNPMPSFTLNCPKDGRAMEKVALSGFTVDRCVSCNALWFDATELQKALHAKGAVKALEPDHKGRVRNTSAGLAACPRCKSPLIAQVDQRQPHVEMLACTVCGGVLLDAGEFTDLNHLTVLERLKAFFA